MNHFAAFMRPQSSLSGIEGTLDGNFDDLDPDDPVVRDRLRYTREHKEQLVYLLGTNSDCSGSSSGGCTSGPGSQLTSRDNPPQGSAESQVGMVT